MTKNFEAKVLRELTVDTAKYRYNVKVNYGYDKVTKGIYRLPINDLDTTAAIDGWELVKEIEV